MNIPTIVTKVAITTIKAGILILSGINFLIRDITIFEQIKTAVVESPIPNPFIADAIKSAVDGIGMGLGFTLALTALGIVREILGNGTLFGMSLFGASYQPACSCS